MSIAFDDTATSGTATKVAAAAGLVVLLVALLAAGAGAGVASLLGGGSAAASATATSAIPPAMLTLYQQAAVTCPGLPWTVLAAIGTVESDNGQSTLPGVASGQNVAGAMGPLQMLGPTFAEYAQPVPPGGDSPPSPYDPTDAVYAAARMLCANGAANGADISGAVFAYNHASWYVTEVLDLAQSYGQTQAETIAAGTAGEIALDWALAQVGTPYIWGGETTGVGFDCSGLTQAAYRVAGVALPRTAQEQYDAGPPIPTNAPLQPGDLVFFGSGPTSVSHVGIYVGVQDGQSIMVDAPRTGAEVRLEPFPDLVGQRWETEQYSGATSP